MKSIIITLIFIGITTWLYVDTNASLDRLKVATIELKTQVTHWVNEYERLIGAYEQLNELYTRSQSKVATLGREVAYLKREVMDFSDKTQRLEQQAVIMKDSHERQIQSYKKATEEAKFNFYYVPMDQRYGVNDLQDYLQRWKWKEGAFVEHKFDCSQMSAHIEWKLENEGFNTVIAAGDSPTGDGRHAWLLVETTEGKYTPVEATSYSIVNRSNPYFKKYYVYEHQFETIHDALRYSRTEFTWW